MAPAVRQERTYPWRMGGGRICPEQKPFGVTRRGMKNRVVDLGLTINECLNMTVDCCRICITQETGGIFCLWSKFVNMNIRSR